MRVAFAGTPRFAAEALAALIAARFEVVLVLTQPDRAAGRGMALQHSAVKDLALGHGIPLHQPATLRSPESWEPIRAAGADLMVVAAYGLILPQAVLDLPRLGCVNIHASLLPRWRGAAPIQRALLAGDTETGITIMRMEAGLDTGPMLATRAVKIAARETAASLHDRLAVLGAQLIVETLPAYAAGRVAPAAQPDEGVTYAHKIDKSEARLDWRAPADRLDRAVRAFNPVPGATAHFHGSPWKIWDAHVLPGVRGEAGKILEANATGIVAGCGSDALRLLELQRPGGKRLPARDFLAGFRLAPGDRFDLPPD